MTDKEAAQWEKVRSKGKGQFQILGALNLGLLLGLVTAVAVFYLWKHFAPIDWPLRIRWVLMWAGILGMPNLMFFVSRRMWKSQEKRYAQWESNKSISTNDSHMSAG